MPTLTPDDWEEDGWTNGELVLCLIVPVLAALGVLLVTVLDWLGEL